MASGAKRHPYGVEFLLMGTDTNSPGKSLLPPVSQGSGALPQGSVAPLCADQARACESSEGGATGSRTYVRRRVTQSLHYPFVARPGTTANARAKPGNLESDTSG